MHEVWLYFSFALAVVTAKSLPDGRIVGGTATTIDRWPMGVAMLYSRSNFFRLHCGGSVINNRSVLSAAHCFRGDLPPHWRSRVGSTMASSAGVVHNSAQLILHSSFNPSTLDNDVAIVRTTTAIVFNNNVRAGSIAGPTFNLPDNSAVWAIGWGATAPGNRPVEQLRQVQIWTINQEICRQRYAPRNSQITANMLCSGWLDVGGRDQCHYDSGGPLLHNHVIVGVCSFGRGCGDPHYPGVNVRVSRFSHWINTNS